MPRWFNKPFDVFPGGMQLLCCCCSSSCWAEVVRLAELSCLKIWVPFPSTVWPFPSSLCLCMADCLAKQILWHSFSCITSTRLQGAHLSNLSESQSLRRDNKIHPSLPQLNHMHEPNVDNSFSLLLKYKDSKACSSPCLGAPLHLHPFSVKNTRQAIFQASGGASAAACDPAGEDYHALSAAVLSIGSSIYQPLSWKCMRRGMILNRMR